MKLHLAIASLGLVLGLTRGQVWQCNFESSGNLQACQIEQDVSDDFDWSSTQRSTPSGSTGPQNDHTTGDSTGYYIYIEASTPRTQNDVARIRLPAVGSPSASRCLTFWYHMHGFGVGELRVVDAANPSNNLDRIIGEQGNEWKSKSVDIPAGISRVAFEGVRGREYSSDIALDDLSIKTGSCSGSQQPDPCASGPCQNGGTCSSTGQTFTCNCNQDWAGSRCEVRSPCASNPCQHGGQCSTSPQGISCSCTQQWTGPRCEVPSGACVSGPCLNGGRCTNTAQGSYTCTCPPGYGGSRCEVLSNACSSAPCQNGGRCQDSPQGFSCTCNPGWVGQLCEVRDNRPTPPPGTRPPPPPGTRQPPPPPGTRQPPPPTQPPPTAIYPPTTPRPMPSEEKQCEMKPKMHHLTPMKDRHFWPLRWADWYNDSVNAAHASMMPPRWNSWGLSSMYKPDRQAGPPKKKMPPPPGQQRNGPPRGGPWGKIDEMMREMGLKKKDQGEEDDRDDDMYDDKDDDKDDDMPPTTANDLKIRLVGGSNNKEGRLEVLYNNQWGTVCSDEFTVNEAQVVCNALGFVGTAVVRPNAYYGQGNGPVWLSGLKCSPKSMHLAQCCHNQFGMSSNCGHSKDVGVMCLDDHFTKLRLAGGSNMKEGRVEVYYSGSWGTVCDDGFTEHEAQVVCNSLGYWGKAEVLRSGIFGQGSGQIWLDGVRCKPHFPHLSHCVHNQFGVHDCNHNNDVAIRCSNFTVEYSCNNGTKGKHESKDKKYDPWRDMEKMKEQKADQDWEMDKMMKEMKPKENKDKKPTEEYLMKMLQMYQEMLNMNMMVMKEMRYPQNDGKQQCSGKPPMQ